MSLKVYIGGKLYDKADAKISVYDHGLLYGDGVFEGIRAYAAGSSGSASTSTGSTSRPSRSTWRFRSPRRDGPGRRRDPRRQQADRRLHPRRSSPEAPAASGSTRARRPTRRSSSSPTRSASIPPELYEHGLKIITAGDHAQPPPALNPRIKSLNYLNNILAKIEGTNAGCLEALMLNHKGKVAECTGDNIFIVRNGELHTPPIDAGILEGITREAVIELARDGRASRSSSGRWTGTTSTPPTSAS